MQRVRTTLARSRNEAAPLGRPRRPFAFFQGLRRLARRNDLAAALWIVVWLCGVAGFVQAAPAQDDGGHRRALLIANANYPDSDQPPTSAVKDAEHLAAQLHEDNFEVDIESNLDQPAMQAAVKAFVDKIRPGDAALVYFNGIGIQVQHKTYLIPEKTGVWYESDVKRNGISLEDILTQLQQQGARVKIAIVDASRHNPFERHFRGYDAGLGGVDAPTGTLILHAVAPNKVGSSTYDDVSLFARELIANMRTADITAEEVMTRTRDSVSSQSNGEQAPWVESTLTEPFYFGPHDGSAPPTSKPAPTFKPFTSKLPPSDAPKPPDQPPVEKPVVVVPPVQKPPADTCAATVTEHDGIVRLSFDDPARATQTTNFTLDDLTYSTHFDGGGHFEAEAPLFHPTAELAWEGISGASCHRHGIVFSNYQTTVGIALVWKGDATLALHILEPPDGRIGGDIHYLSPARPNIDGAYGLGRIRVFGEGTGGTARVELYSLPFNRNPREGTLYAFIEFAARGNPARPAFCGDEANATVSFKVVHFDSGEIERRGAKFGSVPCGTIWSGDPASSGYYQIWKWKL